MNFALYKTFIHGVSLDKDKNIVKSENLLAFIKKK